MKYLKMAVHNWTSWVREESRHVPKEEAQALGRTAAAAYTHFERMRANLMLVEAFYKDAKSRLNEDIYARDRSNLEDQPMALAQLELDQSARRVAYESGAIALPAAIAATRKALAAARLTSEALYRSNPGNSWNDRFCIVNNYFLILGLEKIASEHLAKLEEMLTKDPTEGRSAQARENVLRLARKHLCHHRTAALEQRVDQAIYIAEADGEPVTPTLDALIERASSLLELDVLTEANRWRNSTEGGYRPEKNGPSQARQLPPHGGNASRRREQWRFVSGYQAMRIAVDDLAGTLTAIDLELCNNLLPESPAQLDARVANNCLVAISLAVKLSKRIGEINRFGNDCAISAVIDLARITAELEEEGVPDVSLEWHQRWNSDSMALRDLLKGQLRNGVVVSLA